MRAQKIKNSRQRLSDEYQHLIQSLNRNRLATKEIVTENTDDEYDLATLSQAKDLLYDLNESDFRRLRSIQDALKAIDSGQYGECFRCGEDINEKRLVALPWATLCLQCQEATETEYALSLLPVEGTRAA